MVVLCLTCTELFVFNLKFDRLPAFLNQETLRAWINGFSWIIQRSSHPEPTFPQDIYELEPRNSFSLWVVLQAGFWFFQVVDIKQEKQIEVTDNMWVPVTLCHRRKWPDLLLPIKEGSLNFEMKINGGTNCCCQFSSFELF